MNLTPNIDIIVLLSFPSNICRFTSVAPSVLHLSSFNLGTKGKPGCFFLHNYSWNAQGEGAQVSILFLHVSLNVNNSTWIQPGCPTSLPPRTLLSAAPESPMLSHPWRVQLPGRNPSTGCAQLTFSTLPSPEMLRPGFCSRGRPSLSQVRRGGGTALLRHRSSRAWPSSTDTFCSSPTMSGGTAPTQPHTWLPWKSPLRPLSPTIPQHCPQGQHPQVLNPSRVPTPPLPWAAVLVKKFS